MNKLNTHQTLNNIVTTTTESTNNNGIPLTSSLPLNPAELLYSNVNKLSSKSPAVKTKKSVHHVNGSGGGGTMNGTAILDDNDDDDDETHHLNHQHHHQQLHHQKHIDFSQLM